MHRRLSRLAHGRITGCTWTKTARGSVHMLRRPLAWAVDVADLATAVELGADTVVIRDVESGTTYSAPVSLICQCGLWFNRGHGEQIGLPLRHWDTGAGEHQARQLALDLGRGTRADVHPT